MEIAELHLRLRRVTKFGIEVSFADEEPATGNGTVEVKLVSPATIIWRETGRWDRRFKHLEFSNAYRWSSLENGRLGLEHLRFGDQNPVKLVELNKSVSHPGLDLWKSAFPYLCGKDGYELTVTLSPNDLMLVWRIHGPDKNQISTVCYT